jgi:hypothetical protein
MISRIARSASRSASVTGSKPASCLLETTPAPRKRGNVCSAAAAAIRRNKSAVAIQNLTLLQICHIELAIWPYQTTKFGFSTAGA